MNNLPFVALLACALLLVIACGLLYWMSTSLIPRVRTLANTSGFQEATEDWMTDVRADIEQMGEMLRDQVDERDRRLHERLGDIEKRQLQDDIRDRAASLAHDVEMLKSRSGHYVTLHDLESAIGDIKSELEGMASSLEEAARTLSQMPGPRETAARMDTLDTRLSVVERTFSETLAQAMDESEEPSGDEDDGPDVLAELAGVARSVQQEVASSREQVRQALEVALEVQRASEKLPALEESLSGIVGEVDSLKVTVEALRARVESPPPSPPAFDAELPPDPIRMEEKAASAPLAKVKKNGGSKRGPKLISSAGRAKYREVVSLSSQGFSSSEIALKTGIDPAEIELMLAGQRKS